MLAVCCRCQDHPKPKNENLPELNIQSAKSQRRQNDDDYTHLGGVLSALWPTVSAYVIPLIAATLRARICEILPVHARSAFKFDHLHSSLGEQPALFRQRHEKQPGDKSDEVICTGSSTSIFEMISDISIFLKVVDRELGITGIVVKGVTNVEVVQSSLESSSHHNIPSSIEGLRMFLDTQPEVIVNWSKESSLPDKHLLAESITELVRKTVSSFMLLPNMVAFALSSEADVFDIKSSRYDGIMHLHVKVEERLLMTPMTSDKEAALGPMDPEYRVRNGISSALGLFGIHCSASEEQKERVPSWSDAAGFDERLFGPIVNLQCGAEVGSLLITSAITYNLSFLVCNAKRQKVQLKVWESQLPDAAPLGAMNLAVAEMSAWGSEDLKFDLVNARKEGRESGSSGRLSLAASWRPILEPERLHFIHSPNDDDAVQASFGSLWFLTVGVYAVLGLPRYGEGTLHWIIAECDQIFVEDGASCSKASAAIAENGSNEPTQGSNAEECMANLRRKITILQKQGLTAGAIARVAEFDDQLLPEKAAAAARRKEQPSPPDRTQNLRWEHLFHFSMIGPQRAEVALKLMRKSPGKNEMITDTYVCRLQDLFRSESHRLVQAAAMKNTGALLELRLELRPLERPEGSMVAI